MSGQSIQNLSHQDWEPVVIRRQPTKHDALSNNYRHVSKSHQKSHQNNPNSVDYNKVKSIEKKADVEGSYKIEYISKNMSKQIISTRLLKKWSQKDLAKASNLDVNLIKKYESGEIVPNTQVINKLSKALGIQLKN